jgi:hypothetical protein
MTTQCANSHCGTRFRYFRSGKIFLIDFKANGTVAGHGRDMEYFWLCGECSKKMRVTVDSNGDAILEQLEAPVSTQKKTAAITELKMAPKALSA